MTRAKEVIPEEGCEMDTNCKGCPFLYDIVVNDINDIVIICTKNETNIRAN